MTTLGWRYSLGTGLWMGLLGGVVVASDFNPIAILAFAMQASILGLLLAILYKHREKLEFGQRSLLELGLGILIGATSLFLASLYYFLLVFQTTILIAIVTAPFFVVYRLLVVWEAKSQASAPMQHFVNRMLVMVAIMAPLLVVTFLVAEPLIKGPLPIIGWAIANTVFGLTIFMKFLGEKKSFTKA